MTTLLIVDATGTQRALSVTVNPQDTGYVSSQCLTDPRYGYKQNVSPFGAAFVTSDGIKPTFRYAGTFTPAAAPTDMLVIQGSPTMTGRIKSIVLGGQSTSGGLMLVSLVRRSLANTGGTSVTVAGGKHDTTDSNGTVVPVTYSANPSAVGPSAGTLGQRRLWLPPGSAAPLFVTWDFSTRQDKALILRGIGDFICINGNQSTVPLGATIDFEIEVEEDNS